MRIAASKQLIGRGKAETGQRQGKGQGRDKAGSKGGGKGRHDWRGTPAFSSQQIVSYDIPSQIILRMSQESILLYMNWEFNV